MVGSKAIMKNKQTWKGCWKESELTLASGILLMMEQYGCCAITADHRTRSWRERCHQQLFVSCLQTDQLRRVKHAGMSACSHGFILWTYFTPPEVILERCTSVQNGAMHQAYFTQSVDLLKSLKISRFCLPLAHYHWWVQHSLLVHILWAQLNGEESSPSHTSGLHLPLQLGRIHKKKFYFG